MSLKGKVAIVTGAGGGVGKSTTERLVDEGCKVTLVGRDRSKLSKIVSDYDKSNNLLAASADITKEAEVLNVIEQTISLFDTVDILVNNAGVINDPISFHLMSEDQWDELISTNLKGTFQMTKAVLPIIMGKKTGNIVNILRYWGYVLFRMSLYPFMVLLKLVS
jgi:3-oxoacyl-[acyl-carrier protein] reductase